MKISREGLEKIKGFEGLKLKPSRDLAGFWDIGYGHRTGGKFREITEKEAEEFLIEDIEKIEDFLNSIELQYSQRQFDSLISFAYNLGIGTLRKSMILEHFSRGDLSSVRNIIQKYVHARKNGKMVEVKGLMIRRRWESDAFR